MSRFKWQAALLPLVLCLVVTEPGLLAVRTLAQEPTPAIPVPNLNATSGQRPDEAVRQFLQRAAKFRPTKAELLWQEIPWVAVMKAGRLDEKASIHQALEQARKEKRPILIWSVDGNPFDQC